MKKITETLGIDLSKVTLDAYLHCSKAYQQFENTEKGYKAMLTWARKEGKVKSAELLICFEHTGLYGMKLAAFLEEKKRSYCMVPSIEIKRSLGMVRGKDDRVDAMRIAQYAHLRRENIKETKLPSKLLRKLKQLLALRERMVAQRAGYYAELKELKRIYIKKDNPHLFAVQEKLVAEFSKAISVVEDEIHILIKSDEEVKNIFELLNSIKGIGMVVAANLIVVTQCFKTFENSRQLACYCGVAPFKKQSGTSLRSRSKVSHYANKKIKALLNTSASTAIQYDTELKAYYQRRINGGKSKMSTLNIVRNKLLHRAFAVVKRGTPFVESYQHKVNFC